MLFASSREVYRESSSLPAEENAPLTPVNVYGRSKVAGEEAVLGARRARARDEDRWTHVDRDGRAVHPRRFAAVEPFYNGQARVEWFGGRFEVIDKHGETKAVLR